MIQPLDVTFHLIGLHTRMPFRYGIAALTKTPHLIVRVEAKINGQRVVGQSADHLPPKWFTKDPTTHYIDDLPAMLAVIRHAREALLALGPSPNVFVIWRRLYEEQSRWASSTSHPPLLWHFGVSLMERAIIDAFCRATGDSFATAVRRNTFGIELGAVHPELQGLEPADLLPSQPLRSSRVRHTVGLSDPLTDADIPADEMLDDGLPHSLESNIRAYGLTHFKIKLGGNPDHDLDRLIRVARLLHETVGDAYRHTLDGNEQFPDGATFAAFWERITTEPKLQRFLDRLIFVEQPIHRDHALADDMRAHWAATSRRPPVIIDESDATIGSLRRAIELGYVGTSHKNCKGVCKGLINACLLAHRRRRGEPAQMSGEDLSNLGPIALLQDLAVAATLGLDHVERNGHHYFCGLAQWPGPIRESVLQHHGDLYRRHPDGFPTLAVADGKIDLTSVVAAPFGQQTLIDTSELEPLSDAAAVRAAGGDGSGVVGR